MERAWQQLIHLIPPQSHPPLTVKKSKHRECKQPAQGHTGLKTVTSRLSSVDTKPQSSGFTLQPRKPSEWLPIEWMAPLQSGLCGFPYILVSLWKDAGTGPTHVEFSSRRISQSSSNRIHVFPSHAGRTQRAYLLSRAGSPWLDLPMSHK